MTEALVPYETRTLADTMRLGEVLARSGYFADSREAAQAVVKVLAGSELGFGPIASMTGVNIIKGKVTLSANLIAAAIKRSGRYNYRVMALTDEVCRIEFYEGGQTVGVSEFTMADAKAAGLAGDNWRKFPRNMLFARAISNGAKWYCPDLSGGPLYTPDELGATVDGETGEVIDVPVVVTLPAQPATNEPAVFEPEPGEDVWADWKRPEHAQAWAMTQGKFNARRHMENAYAKVKDECKPANAREMWRCWYAYVMAHEPAKAQATEDGTWDDIDAHGHDDEPRFN